MSNLFAFVDTQTQDFTNICLQNGFIIFSVVSFIALQFIPAHYGKFYDSKKNLPAVSNRFGWFVEETPNIIITLYYGYYFWKESANFNLINYFMISFFFVHYIHRSFIYPFKLANTKKLPLDVMVIGCSFCLANALMQNRSIFLFSKYSWDEINPAILAFGIILFLTGMYINIYHDYLMISLKKGSNSYVLPSGGLFDYIASPNYFGEIIEWIGFALIVNTYSSWIFVFSTISNLSPRALQTLQWYKTKFENYPKERKAIIPYII
jgi:3-oxo-5-alpha-steroid 4-dehydrogenase 1